ncbi:hypothetical protein BGX28_004976 [Mortierella sp. GBA30]|nr:hypothetical protein BGX28_004976 [Mortierella sp. GBA30]
MEECKGLYNIVPTNVPSTESFNLPVMVHGQAINPLGLPEITHILSDHLAKGDLTRCLRVCKAWSQSFLPSVWHNLVLGRRPNQDRTSNILPCPPSEVLHRYRHLVQELVLYADIPVDVFRIHYPKLKVATIYDNWDCLPGLLSLNRTILELRLRFSDAVPLVGPTEDKLTPILVALPVMPELKHLYLTGCIMAFKDITDVFWLACRGLTTLSIVQSYIHHFPDPSTITNPDLMPTGLKRLTLDSQACLRKNIPVEWMAKNPGLKYLSWSNVRYGGPTDEFAKHAMQGAWPELEELEFSICSLRFPADRIMADIISGMNQARVLHMRETTLGPLSFNCLQSHFHCLQSLEMQQCLGVTSLMVQQILASCAKLECLRGCCLLGRDVVEDGRPWVCTGLITLDLNFWIQDPPHLETLERELVLDRLSTLTKLERLATCTCCENEHLREVPGTRLEFRLDKGLAKLVTMTRLETLITYTEPDRLDPEDVQWMVDHWKKLKELPWLLDAVKTRGSLEAVKHVLNIVNARGIMYDRNDPRREIF